MRFFTGLDREKVHAELHVFPEAGHGFGPGKGFGEEHPGPGFVGADEWIRLADIFMEVGPAAFAAGLFHVKFVKSYSYWKFV